MPLWAHSVHKSQAPKNVVMGTTKKRHIGGALHKQRAALTTDMASYFANICLLRILTYTYTHLREIFTSPFHWGKDERESHNATDWCCISDSVHSCSLQYSIHTELSVKLNVSWVQVPLQPLSRQGKVMLSCTMNSTQTQAFSIPNSEYEFWSRQCDCLHLAVHFVFLVALHR